MCRNIHLFPNLGLLLRERICSSGSKFFPLRVTPNFQVIPLGFLIVTVKIIIRLWNHKNGIENQKKKKKNQGKVREI